MTNISVPREPTEAMLNAPLMGGRFENRLDLRKHIYKAMIDAAPAVDGELEALLFLDEGDGVVTPLCSLPKAQAIIEPLRKQLDEAKMQQKVVMPERRPEIETDEEFAAWVRGWNACLDQFERLNGGKP